MAKIDFSQFKTLKDLQHYADDLFTLVASEQAENIRLKDRVKHLESLMMHSKDESIPVASNELELCKLEIARLYTEAKIQPLDDKQIRAFDIYVKCMLNIQGKELPKAKPKKQEVLSQEELINLALQAIETDKEQ
jgi:hypothetical protein